MSTEFIETNLELMMQDLVTSINDEPFDMLDEFDAEDIANEVISIAKRLIRRDFCNGHIIKGRIDYIYHVNNKVGGWVSLSNDDSTGVSRTLYLPFNKDDKECLFTSLFSLAQMINEAWYLCNN